MNQREYNYCYANNVIRAPYPEQWFLRSQKILEYSQVFQCEIFVNNGHETFSIDIKLVKPLNVLLLWDKYSELIILFCLFEIHWIPKNYIYDIRNKLILIFSTMEYQAKYLNKLSGRIVYKQIYKQTKNSSFQLHI